jgi:transcriptional regulator with XRE-family HTH domain
MKSDYYEKLGPYIKMQREKTTLTQLDVAEMLKVDRTTYTRWERGDRPIPVTSLYDIVIIIDKNLVEKCGFLFRL